MIRNPSSVRDTGTFKIQIEDHLGSVLAVTKEAFGLPADSFHPGVI